MKTYAALPTALLEGWTARDSTHPPLQQIGFHYHDVEEWLQITSGGMTFYPLSDQPCPAGTGAVLRIPRGEVHKAEIWTSGVTYRMYLPIEDASGFSVQLRDDEIEVLRANLAFPEHEENLHVRAREFFDEQLSEHLAFCRADGSVAGKAAFRGPFVPRGRTSSGTIAVLTRTADTLLISTEVTVATGTPAARTFTNIRLFKKEEDGWRCRVWVNYPASEQARVAVPITR